MAIDQPKTDKEWQAHGDAHTLSEAKIIMADEKRLKAAIDAAKKIVDELEEKAKGMGGVASGDLAGKMYPKMEEKKE
jgi:hypothetical protein